MFKGNTNTNTKMSNSNSPERLNRIVEGTRIEGEINSESNIRIDGHVTGTIKTKGRVVIGTTGVIEGDVYCLNADVEGVIRGTIQVGDLLSLKTTAKITGDISTKKLLIESGAEFNGSCNMGEEAKSSISKASVSVEGVLER
ncbi:MAG: cytoskeletal protein CcmA (bactofilin family) [Parvicella sp.]|jgi:cytoskeletal protein CcmA (bactofilin family)